MIRSGDFAARVRDGNEAWESIATNSIEPLELLPDFL